MSGYFHRMLSVDPVSLTGICDVCGPVDAYLYPKQRQWVCGKKRKSQKMLHQHGLTSDAWDALFESQGRACAVCRRTEPGSDKGWHTDHDHECCPGKRSCGKCIRGILCPGCNVGIGHLRNDCAILAAACDYLRRTR